MSRIESVEPAASASGKAFVTTMAGAGTLSLGGLSANDIAMAVGAIVAVLGLLVQWYYRHKEYKLRERESNARMAERGFYDQ